MRETTYRDRRAFQIESDRVRVTVLQEGGHIAEIASEPTCLAFRPIAGFPAESRIDVRYRAAIALVDAVPESLIWSDIEGAVFASGQFAEPRR